MTENNRPNATITITYPEGSAPEQIATGSGMEASISAHDMGEQDVVTALLMACEHILSQRVRQMHDEAAAADPLTQPPADVVRDSLISLNARVLLMHEVSELPFAPGARSMMSYLPDSL